MSEPDNVQNIAGRSIDTYRTLFIPTGSQFTDMVLVAQSRNADLINKHKEKIKMRVLFKLGLFSAILLPVTAVIFTQTDHVYWSAIPLSIYALLIGYTLLVFVATIKVLNGGLKLAMNRSNEDLEQGQSNENRESCMVECRTNPTYVMPFPLPPSYSPGPESPPKPIVIRTLPALDSTTTTNTTETNE